MENSRKNQVLQKLEIILNRDIPNELKSHRIYNDIIMGLLDDLRNEYEQLFFAEYPKNLTDSH